MINIGTDFSGVGAFEQALMRLKIEYHTAFACEIDKYARQTYMANYDAPDYFPHDVYDRVVNFLPSLDIYMTSPPCQSFSLAGHRKGENDERGTLFYNSHEFIKANKPRYFIFENVKGLLSDDDGKTFRRWLDFLGGKSVNGNPLIFPHEESLPYHIYYQVLNAKHYGVPQNRERVFIIGIRDDADNDFKFPKPFELKKRLKDVLEEDVDKKYYLSERMLEYFTEHKKIHKERGNGFKFEPKNKNDIAGAISTLAGSRQTDNYVRDLDIVGDLNKGGQKGAVFSDETKLMSCLTATDYKQPKQILVPTNNKKGFEEAKEGDSINFQNPSSKTRRGRVGKQIAQTIDTGSAQGVVIGAIRGRGDDNDQQLEIGEEECSNSLTTVQKDNVVVNKNYIQWDVSGKGYNSQQDRAYFEEGNMGTLSASNQSGNKHNVLLENYKVRRLTPRECFRLMDFPDDFKIDAVSATQAYKQAGNSIVVGVLVEILKKLKL